MSEGNGSGGAQGEPSLSQILAAMERNRHETSQAMEKNRFETAQAQTKLLEQLVNKVSAIEAAAGVGPSNGASKIDRDVYELGSGASVGEGQNPEVVEWNTDEQEGKSHTD
ncbi:hypothetical protein EJB05_46098, partial [Eragrostis curvula]